MSHPSEGVLRLLVDEPAGVADTDGQHAHDCETCARLMGVVRHDAELVEAALAVDIGAIDVDAAWQRFAATLDGGRAATVGVAPDPVAILEAVPSATGCARRPRRAGRVRSALRRPAVAGVAVGLVVAGAGAAAAADWFEIFRTERIAPIGISVADLNALPDLSSYGDLDVNGEPDVRQVADAEAAEEASGLDLPEVAELPRGVTGEPTYQVGDDVTATFTFSEEQAAASADEAGEELAPLPPELDGTQVQMTAGPGVAQVWRSESGAPGLLVGRALAPTASSSSDVSFEELRDQLVDLPGLPEEVADGLRAFNADGSTLPLPVPEGLVTTEAATIDGQPATVLTTRDRALAAVVWVEDGLVTVVAGPLDVDEVLAVARGLR